MRVFAKKVSMFKVFKSDHVVVAQARHEVC